MIIVLGTMLIFPNTCIKMVYISCHLDSKFEPAVYWTQAGLYSLSILIDTLVTEYSSAIRSPCTKVEMTQVVSISLQRLDSLAESLWIQKAGWDMSSIHKHLKSTYVLGLRSSKSITCGINKVRLRNNNRAVRIMKELSEPRYIIAICDWLIR